MEDPFYIFYTDLGFERFNFIEPTTGKNDFFYKKPISANMHIEVYSDELDVPLLHIKKRHLGDTHHVLRITQEVLKDLLKGSQGVGWIPVTERLPESTCNVWAAKSNGKVCEMEYANDYETGNLVFQYWSMGEWLNQHEQVTHWMPLPAHPDTIPNA